MKTDKKFPFKYYLALLLGLVLTVYFWYWVLNPEQTQTTSVNTDITNYFDNPEFRQYQDYLPDEIGVIIPVDTNEIEVDSASGRSFVSNLINIALKNQQITLKTFLLDLLKKVDTSSYKVVYADTTINRVQLEIKSQDRKGFVAKIRRTLSNHDLLIWDEVLFGGRFNDSKMNDPNCAWYFTAINAQQAWKISTGNKDVIIAVIDNGFDINHPELRGKEIKPYNVVQRNNNVSPSTENHGTHVAATIVANSDNNLGLIGIVSQCRYMPIKVADQSGIITNSYVVDGILYAIKNKASVINISLGMAIDSRYVFSELQQENYINTQGKDEENFWNELFKYADLKNVTCVLAAGNENMLAGFDPFKRSKYTIKVGAFDKNFKKASFSNYGNYVNIYAPGVSIYSAKPNSSFEYLQGTSMASPIVAGVIALIKSTNRGITNEDIMKRLSNIGKSSNGINIIDAYKFLQ